MNISAKVASAVLFSAIVLSGCGINPEKDAVVMINDTPITKQQYEQEFKKIEGNPMFKQMGVDLKKDKDGYVGLMIKDKIINELMVKTLLDQAMKKNNIKVSNEEVEKELKSLIDKIGSKDKFNELLKQNGISSADFKKDLKEEVKIKKLIDQLSIVKISDSDTRKFYDSNLDKFKYPDKVRASHILISADADRIREVIKADEKNKDLSEAQIDEKVKQDIAAKYQKAQKILAEVKLDQSKFAKLAKENSDDPGSAEQGGDLGYFTKDQMVPEFANAAFSARPSIVTDIVKSPYGYHIILVKDRIAAGVEPYEKVKGEIAAFLENQKKVEVLQKFLADAKKDAKIVYVDESFNPDTIQKEIKDKVKDMPIPQMPLPQQK